MPAASIILPLAETVFGSAISTAVTGTLASAGITLASGTLGALETGAIIGAGEGAVNAAVTGGDIAKGALTGGVGGGVGAGVGAELTKDLGATPSTGGYSGIPETPATPASIAGSPTAASGLIEAAKGGSSALAGALAGGAPLSTALQQGLRAGEIGGISGLVSGLAQNQFSADQGTAKDIGTAAGTIANYALPSASGGTTPSYTPPAQPGLSAQGPAPSPTLGQSLSIAPTLGYTPGGTVFGSSEGDQPKQRVWNVASLRNIGEEA
jgi:hypothetical protein